METKPDTEFEGCGKGVALPPRWLAYIVAILTPPTDEFASRKFLLNNLWNKYPSVTGVLARLPMALAGVISVQTLDAFYWRMSIPQACILFIAFADALSVPLLLIIGLTFALLAVREAYVRWGDRLECEVITTFMAPALIVGLNVALGWAVPGLMVPLHDLLLRAVKLAIPIAFLRYNYGPHVGPEHPYKDLLRLHHRTGFFNLLWMTGGLVYLNTLDLAAPRKWEIQALFTLSPAMIFFASSVRLQLNPLGGNFRHRRICLSLLTDPFEDEIKMKRAYLLTGADWFHHFCLQSLYEIVGFLFALSPILIGLVQWYIGDPNAARIHWLQMAVNSAAWVVLVVTWHCLKKINRETASVFDQTIQTFRKRSLYRS